MARAYDKSKATGEAAGQGAGFRLGRVESWRMSSLVHLESPPRHTGAAQATHGMSARLCPSLHTPSVLLGLLLPPGARAAGPEWPVSWPPATGSEKPLVSVVC